MNPEAQDLWKRAIKTLETARSITNSDPDSSASRAYYAAFHAVSALFASEGKSFTKHSALEAAIHRDLVNAERCSEEVGIYYSELVKLRSTADYGFPSHVSGEEAMTAVNKAQAIIKAIEAMLPNPG